MHSSYSGRKNFISSLISVSTGCGEEHLKYIHCQSIPFASLTLRVTFSGDILDVREEKDPSKVLQ
jgi:hypothetical protein